MIIGTNALGRPIPAEKAEDWRMHMDTVNEGFATRNSELIKRAERWLTWYKTWYVDGSNPLFLCHDGARLIRECVAALKTDAPASTQRHPSQVDLPAPDWLAYYAVPIEAQVLSTWKQRLWSAREEASDAVQRP